MLRHHIRALGLILQPGSFYSVEFSPLTGKKTALQAHRFSTESVNERILDKIFSLSTNELKNINSSEWIERINVIRAYNFSESECFNILSKETDLLLIEPHKLNKTLNQWHLSRFKVEKLKEIILTNPELLEVEPHVIRTRVSQLSLFCSLNLSANLLLTCPNVMFDDWNMVLQKITYLLKVRGFKMGAVVESHALSNSFDFIKFRFDILEKCGIYKQMTLYAHKINKYDQSQHKNPSLHSILQPDKESFSSALAKISVEEYDVCYELFMEASDETEEDSDNDVDDDDDDDDDDNDDDDSSVEDNYIGNDDKK